MGLHPVWIVGNGVAVQATLITMSYLFYRRVLARGWRWPWASTAIVTVTALVTGLSFVDRDLLALLRRDTDGLLAGEVWRVVTPWWGHDATPDARHALDVVTALIEHGRPACLVPPRP